MSKYLCHREAASAAVAIHEKVLCAVGCFAIIDGRNDDAFNQIRV